MRKITYTHGTETKVVLVDSFETMRDTDTAILATLVHPGSKLPIEVISAVRIREGFYSLPVTQPMGNMNGIGNPKP
jgi:hypothetical protein